jgi:hypothetical protein
MLSGPVRRRDEHLVRRPERFQLRLHRVLVGLPRGRDRLQGHDDGRHRQLLLPELQLERRGRDPVRARVTRDHRVHDHRRHGTIAAASSGINCDINSNPSISNTVVAFCMDFQALYCDLTSTPEITHSVSYGNAVNDSLCGDHHDNAFVDPLFCGMGYYDLELCEDSPCLAGNNAWGERRVRLAGQGDLVGGDQGALQVTSRRVRDYLRSTSFLVSLSSSDVRRQK